jgi:hypothetical protein
LALAFREGACHEFPRAVQAGIRCVINSTLFSDTPKKRPIFGTLQGVPKNVCSGFLKLAD